MSIVSENPEVATAIIKALMIRLGLKGATAEISEAEVNAPFDLASRSSPDGDFIQLRLVPVVSQ